MGYPLHLIQVVGGNEHGNFSIGAQRLNELDHAYGAIGVQAQGRLVEETDLGILDEHFRDAQPLAHPAGEGSHLLLRIIGEPDDLKGLIDFRGRDLVGDVVELCYILDILPCCHIPIKAHVLRQITNQPLHLEGFPRGVESADPSIPL